MNTESLPSTPVTTLADDFYFQSFTASSTLSYGAQFSSTKYGPTGNYGGEGHYGLILVGDAQIEHCDSNKGCCDGFDVVGGRGPVTCTHYCYIYDDFHQSETVYINDAGQSEIRSNFPSYLDYHGVSVGEMNTYNGNFMPSLSRPCGVALRLTPSLPQLCGAAWYPRPQEVSEGFQSIFRFRLSDPAVHCKVMNDVDTNCRFRGGDGFAFVIQNYSPMALGGNGMDLGYGGIPNSVAIEFDTWFNYELLDVYENHISVHTVPNMANTPSHNYSVGATASIPDLGSGDHMAKVVYRPTFDEDILAMPSFQASSYFATFLSQGPSAEPPVFSGSLGILEVYVDDLFSPVLAVPLPLEDVLDLDMGRAWVGFTAATGDQVYQTHDILWWRFQSLRSTT